MTGPRTLDLSGLPPYEISNKAPLWWGQLLLCVIEASTFFVLIAIYFYLRLSVDMWPPPGTQLPHLPWATLALIPLVLSVGGSYWASEGAKKDSVFQMLSGLGVNVILALVFLWMRYMEWSQFNFRWDTDSHGSIVWSILYLHTLDAVADILYTLVLIVILVLGKVGPKQRLGVHVDSIVWYFIVAIWLPLYGLLYWGPRWIGAP